MKQKPKQKPAGWRAEVAQFLDQLPTTFTTGDVYAVAEKPLAKRHPENHNVRAKIRQQLQLLRDAGQLRTQKSGTGWQKVQAI